PMVVQLVTVLALLAMTAGCGGRSPSKPRLGEVERVPRLETELPRKNASLLVRRDFTATVEAMEKVDLCAQVRGVISGLAPDIDIGRFVRGPSVPPQVVATAFGFVSLATTSELLLAAAMVAS